jgi:hypothetical protein
MRLSGETLSFAAEGLEMKFAVGLVLLCFATATNADTRGVFLEDAEGARIQIATVETDAAGRYQVEMDNAPFEDHFLSMRPFKCLEGPSKHWCHVPYPYEIERDVSEELTDLEYDFLFVWKEANEYGINMWNGVYYKLDVDDERLIGRLHEMDMDVLSAPPDAGVLRPLSAKHLHESDPDSHWLPRMIVE